MSSAGLVRMGRYYVPLGTSPVVRHFVRHHLVAHDVRQRLSGSLARGLVDVGLEPLAARALRTGYPARCEGPPWTGADRLAVEDMLSGLGIPDEDFRLHVLDSLPDGPGGSGGLVFGFPEGGGGSPSLVVKVRRREGGRPGLATEWRALRELRQRLSGEQLTTVPAPLAHRCSERLEMVAMTHLRGTPVYLDLHNGLAVGGRASLHLAAAVSWLVAFQEATSDASGASGQGMELSDPEQLRSRLPHPRRPGSGGLELGWYHELRSEWRRKPLVPAAAHGDFWARNLLMVGGRTSGVVDWEHYRPRSLPTTDLFHLLVSYGSAVRWTRFRRTPPETAFRKTFVEENRISRAVRHALRTYGRLRGVPVAMLEKLFLLYLLTGGRGGIPEDGGRAGPGPLDSVEAGRAYQLMRTASRTVFSP